MFVNVARLKLAGLGCMIEVVEGVWLLDCLLSVYDIPFPSAVLVAATDSSRSRGESSRRLVREQSIH
jgi:hypothetical protein